MILGILLGGIAYLATSYGIMAMDQTQPGYQSVLSQLVGAVAGRGAFYYVAIASALGILCLSANTSFVGFPRMCRLVAQDEFLPRPFATAGRRLVYSVGIIYLAITAGLLLTLFDGVTDRLIPLFAIGAFLTFTMSQAGMVAHWRRELRNPRRTETRRRVLINLVINAVGAATTVTALAVIVIAKFGEGGWITIVAIPCVIVLHKAIKRYYSNIEEHLHDDDALEFRRSEPPVVLVTMREWNRLTDKALRLAMELSPDVTAVHLASLEGRDVDKEERELRQQWAAHVEKPAKAAKFPNPPRLVFLSAPYRRIHAPLLQLIKEVKEENPGRTIAVLIPELVKRHWWEYLLSNHRARRLRSAVLDYGGSGVVVIGVPWYLTEPQIEEGMTDEEAAEPVQGAERARLSSARLAAQAGVAASRIHTIDGIERESLSRRCALLDDLALELERPRRQLGVLGRQQEGIEAAAMVDGLERIGGDAQPNGAAERIRHQRDVEQVRQKPPFGLAVRVAHAVPDLAGFSGELAAPGHGNSSIFRASGAGRRTV